MIRCKELRKIISMCTSLFGEWLLMICKISCRAVSSTHSTCALSGNFFIFWFSWQGCRFLNILFLYAMSIFLFWFWKWAISIIAISTRNFLIKDWYYSQVKGGVDCWWELVVDKASCLCLTVYWLWCFVELMRLFFYVHTWKIEKLQ